MVIFLTPRYPKTFRFRWRQEILAEAWSEQILPGWPPMVAETQLDSPLVIDVIGWLNLMAFFGDV
jgi:hypothetical protein